MFFLFPFLELSPNLSFVLNVIDFYNNCIKYFLIFEPKISSKKFIHIFQVSLQETLFFDFCSFIVYRKWCEAQLHLFI